ncbi:hypothetical protein NPIL_497981 [Nephila pilipes]|uniref:Uncharacterized protein n=1 Tax=Nephila pilipes TaxID=299642 RepID=A0A8X6TTG2_NEPPI|nr:hypothetical protein NPIL_497981 [Nephila pilipes]
MFPQGNYHAVTLFHWPTSFCSVVTTCTGRRYAVTIFHQPVRQLPPWFGRRANEKLRPIVCIKSRTQCTLKATSHSSEPSKLLIADWFPLLLPTSHAL